MAIEKYIIDKSELTTLLIGEVLTIRSKGNIKGVGVETVDKLTNGDMIKAMFPYGSYGTNGEWVHVLGVGGNGILVFKRDWWDAPYSRK